jgi:hypothetical protein
VKGPVVGVQAVTAGQIASREPKEAKELDLSGLPELPETVEEVQKVAALYPVRSKNLNGRKPSAQAG